MEKNSSDIIVNFSDVTKQYGDLVVLDKLNLEIKKNEMVSIIGPSGSGKTTVLRVLMTLEKDKPRCNPSRWRASNTYGL
jgi:polar amino acid transport system ATP-binding protein